MCRDWRTKKKCCCISVEGWETRLHVYSTFCIELSKSCRNQLVGQFVTVNLTYAPAASRHLSTGIFDQKKRWVNSNERNETKKKIDWQSHNWSSTNWFSIFFFFRQLQKFEANKMGKVILPAKQLQVSFEFCRVGRVRATKSDTCAFVKLRGVKCGWRWIIYFLLVFNVGPVDVKFVVGASVSFTHSFAVSFSLDNFISINFQCARMKNVSIGIPFCETIFFFCIKSMILTWIFCSNFLDEYDLMRSTICCHDTDAAQLKIAGSTNIRYWVIFRWVETSK